MTYCEECCGEVDDDEVEYCPKCEADGLCPDCLNRHDDGNEGICYGPNFTDAVASRKEGK